MAGHPKRKRDAIETELNARAALLEWDGEDAPTGLDYVVGWLESGSTLLELAADLSNYCPVTISRWNLSDALNVLYGEAYVQQRLAEAKLQSADPMAEKALERTVQLTLDSGGEPRIPTRDEIQAAHLEIQTRRWLAERYNPKAYGDQKGPAVTVNLNSLHLEALQAMRPQPTATVMAAANTAMESGPGRSLKRLNPETPALPSKQRKTPKAKGTHDGAQTPRR